MRILSLGLILLFGVQPGLANDNFLQGRCEIDFPEAMLLLQDTIKQHGYTISRVQHVDKGLNTRGYPTELYKVVFFGKEKEIANIERNYPELIPYIPLSITIFNNKNSSRISSLKPGNIARIYKGKGPTRYFHQWDRDFVSIFKTYNKCNKT